MAFCKWLTHRLGYDKRDLEVRLPTEWEWERAARGAGGSEFPWGAEYVHGYANVNETYGENPGPHFLGRTSAVGIYYPHEESTAETQESGAIFDLAGNVWEWCLDESKESSRTSSGGTKARVVRGGSWLDLRHYARAVSRYYFDPDYRINDVGFRVVCSSPMKRRSPRR
jgi:formylglycine-generating enzyme required for sulfatase activity